MEDGGHPSSQLLEVSVQGTSGTLPCLDMPHAYLCLVFISSWSCIMFLLCHNIIYVNPRLWAFRSGPAHSCRAPGRCHHPERLQYLR